MDLRAFDLHQFERITRERQQLRAFVCLKDGQRYPMRRAVVARASPFYDPVTQGGVGGVQVGELLASQEAAFGEVDAALDLAFVLRRARSIGADQEAVVLRLPTVRLAKHRVVQVRL